MLCGFDWEENSKERAEAMEKSIHELEVEFVYLILWENRELSSVVRGRLTAPSNSN